jgi:hypothetical protein
VKKIALIFLFIMVAAGAAWGGEEFMTDPDAEPDGFRGIEWQRKMSDVPGLVEIYRDEASEEVSCSRTGDEMKMGDAELASIEYIFVGGRLSKVVVVAKGEKNEDALLAEAKNLFGRETVRSGADYMWRFTDVAVMFSKEPQLEQSVLFFHYIGFMRKR